MSLPDDIQSDFFEEEELRKQITAKLEKMDLAQLTIMSAMADVSAEDKQAELDEMLDNPRKRFRRK